MESKYIKVNRVEIFEGDLVRLKIPVEDKFATDKKRIFICIFGLSMAIDVLKCQYGILHGLWCTKNTDHLAATIPHQIPPYLRDSH